VKHLLLFGFFCCFLPNGTAQSVALIDSLSIKIKTLPNDTNKVKALYALAFQYRLHKPDSTHLLGQQAYELSRRLQYPLGEARALSIMGIAFKQLGDYALALDMFIQAKELAVQLKNTERIVATLNNIADLYMEQEDWQKGLETMQECYALYSTIANPAPRAKPLYLTNIGECFYNLRQLDSANVYLYRALPLAKSLDDIILGVTLYTLGDVAFSKNNTEQAHSFYRQSIEFSIQHSINIRLYEGAYRMAKMFQTTHQTDSLLHYAQLALATSQNSHYGKGILKSSQLLAEIYEGRNDAEALRYYKIAVAAKDSLYSQDKVRRLLSIAFEDKQQALEIERARTEFKKKINLFVFFGILLSAGGYLFYRIRLHSRLAEKEAQRLQQLNTFRTNFFANISHEFRTPLTMLIGPTENALSRLPEMKTGEWSDLLHTVRRNGYRLLNLVNQLLDLARLEAGKMQLAPVNGDLVAFLRDLVDSCHSYAQTRRILIHFESEAPELQMAFDPDKIQTIFANLLSNALKFTPEGGRIDLRLTMEDVLPGDDEQETVNRHSSIVIQVTDTGSGIPEDRLGLIFDRFYQLDHSTTRKGEGAGIGLALVQELVKLLEGTIAVENAVGAGASFRVRLPYLPPQPALRALETDQMPPEKFIAPLPPPQPEVAGLGDVPPTVALDQAALPVLLIVEDDADVRRYLAECVKHEYRVVMADNGDQGIQKATELIPDIIISDVMMPGKDGLELCETLKNDGRTSHIPIVLLTARIDVESRIAGLKRGADVYLAKPFEPAELQAQLDNLVRLRRRLQQRYAAMLLAPLPNDDPGLVLEDVFLLKIRKVVEAHLADSDFEMRHLELTLAMSYSQIFRKVKALTGGSPSMLIRSIRLYKAKELLLDSSLTIGEVAYAVGFSTPAYFSTTFLEAFGKTPGEFRRG